MTYTEISSLVNDVKTHSRVPAYLRPVLSAILDKMQVPKVYRALLYQDVSSASSGTLVIGKQYLISSLTAGDDFSNVGYVDAGTIFTATGTTPTVWTNGTEVVDIAESAVAPVVLQNELGGVPIFSYQQTGINYVTLEGAFPENKTFLNFCPPVSMGFSGFTASRLDNNSIGIMTGISGSPGDVMNPAYPASLEILVYP